ncbi:FAD-binding protein [Sedimentibacter sp. zth1]|uniref:NAD(P)/FAD-dependent oxidoreductase n=1 Tax=Sedimentibacter sp. zth1 TaxID=2816908 RepID=UPI001A92573F|nr:FAD-binding protein [Sedimentibacter sp. zth1]QSX05536.1 FAD-binding protein [Sedimentibacter sp. zth1]
MKYDVVIAGAGPSGIFTALELVKNNSQKKILLVEKGKSIEKRSCPKDKTKECVHCKPYCNITTGFSGAGAFSDGKLSLSSHVGGDLPDLIGYDVVEELIKYTDEIYLKFGADTKVEGVGNSEDVKGIRRKAIEAGLKLVDCPIRHLGTEKAQEIYLKIEQYLISNGVEIRFNTLAKDFIVEDNSIKGLVIANSTNHDTEKEVYAEKVIVCAGRKGAEWLKELCVKHHINHSAGTVDIGVRVEVRNEVMEEVNNILYESKLIGYPLPFKNKVRTFCQNPGGFVSQENYDNDLAVVNGHSYKNLKSSNTNLAILCSHNFSKPFNEPIKYGIKVAELTNMLGNGHIIVQRYGDILEGKRTWQKELNQSNVIPTLSDAVAGDLTSAIPYRTMVNLLNFIEQMNKVVPGFASVETLLYGPEIKFYSNKINIDDKFETNIKGLYCLGDSSGWTRGLMMASLMGVRMAKNILNEKK